MEISKSTFEEESEATIRLKQTGAFISVEVEGDGFAYDLAAELAKSIQPEQLDGDLGKAH
jgi:hypothetical protein